ncbi:MAG: TIGR04376 family protein [Candidatus Parcubacteria bacterium]|uniref:TIGR04376 family protein n=1 Tax=Phormidesmis priestleyi TaxID=268141 RepID=UPI00083B9545|nr:TIGR04376 family protein [Phormidesmis priestleyi]MBC7822424.1 TIGR04376 family protein [Leptolyngbyaceae cyanobacterium LF-bin-113]
MGLFDDFSQFLEARLDEFMRNNPHLELQALEEKLREQEQETRRLMADLRLKEQQLQDGILATAQEIQRWHSRIEKAKTAGRMDLAEPAQAHEAGLLREGNQKWGQMEILKQRLKQTEELQQQIQTRRQEVQTKLTEAQAARAAQTETRWAVNGWNQDQNATYMHGSADPLEQEFKRWEAQEELEQMKRKMGK